MKMLDVSVTDASRAADRDFIVADEHKRIYREALFLPSRKCIAAARLPNRYGMAARLPNRYGMPHGRFSLVVRAE